MDVVIVIPARYASQRYPGKPLVALKGASGEARSLLKRTHEAAMAVPHVREVIVATDDERIAEPARAFSSVMMTSSEARNGTERCAEVAAKLPKIPDVIVNVQGDAPLTPPDFVTALIEGMGDADVATPVLRCDTETLRRFLDDRAAGQVGGTTAVMDRAGRALYFSKEVIPHVAGRCSPDVAQSVFHHVGIYAYRPAALTAYADWEPGVLERFEGLEQLRFLENGATVRCVEVRAEGRHFWELNNPVDVPRIEAALADMGID